LRAESLIYDGGRQRAEKRKELENLKRQGKCLDWINDIEAGEPVFQEVSMPPGFVPLKRLKNMATDLGGEWECDYHFIYWNISKLAHPSVLGSHTYIQQPDLDAEMHRAAETHRAIAVAFSMHWRLSLMALSLLNLDALKPQLDSYAAMFVAAKQ
jgi:hypothetical protein